MAQDTPWITEHCEEAGSAFGLRIQHRLHSEQTPYQRIEVYETTDWGNLMLIDGCTMISSRDNFLYHEMMAHPALFTHAAPEQIVIIGGGDCGTLREVARHPDVKRITQIDIDERVTRIAEQFFPELCEANNDPRVELLFEDGIEWMRNAPADSIDVIIVDSTDPIGPGEVLFTEDFYRACHCALAQGGIVVQQSESPLIHMPLLERMYLNLKRAGFGDLRTLFFPQPIYPTGWWSATLGGKGEVLHEFREAAARRKTFPTRYYNVDTHRAACAEPEFFKQAAATWRAQ